ncbi:Tbf1 protein [Saccharomycopsis crataegensis]|uniref:Tbf1 protein n=1 Tax=Saccharomycopsis crataegensis TaxID=43959 RepID=A0AAV5QEE8_9ASCO|nr:Tbf1 protein [Saccharomycopsis crataegensis]
MSDNQDRPENNEGIDVNNNEALDHNAIQASSSSPNEENNDNADSEKQPDLAPADERLLDFLLQTHKETEDNEANEEHGQENNGQDVELVDKNSNDDQDNNNQEDATSWQQTLEATIQQSLAESLGTAALTKDSTNDDKQLSDNNVTSEKDDQDQNIEATSVNNNEGETLNNAVMNALNQFRADIFPQESTENEKPDTEEIGENDSDIQEITSIHSQQEKSKENDDKSTDMTTAEVVEENQAQVEPEAVPMQVEKESDAAENTTPPTITTDPSRILEEITATSDDERQRDQEHIADKNVAPSPLEEGQPRRADSLTTEDQNNEQQPSKEIEESSNEAATSLTRGLSVLEKIREVSTIPYVSANQAQLAALPLIITAPNDWPFETQLSVNSLPILDNLATQLLRIYVSSSYEDIVAYTQPMTIEDPENPENVIEAELSPDAESFQALVRLFSIARSVYTRTEKDFIGIEDVAPGFWKNGETAPLFVSGREEIFDNSIRKANLATFICGVVNSIEMEFVSLDENFLEVFCPNDTSNYLVNVKKDSMDDIVSNVTGYGIAGRLTKPQASLYLELKTQAYISAVMAHESKEVAEADLEHLFPDNIEQNLLSRRQLKHLSSIELDFVSRCKSRKGNLRNISSIEDLIERYSFDSFVKKLLDYMKTNLGFILYGRKRRTISPNKTLWDANSEHVTGSTFSSIYNNRLNGNMTTSAMLANLNSRNSVTRSSNEPSTTEASGDTTKRADSPSGATSATGSNAGADTPVAISNGTDDETNKEPTSSNSVSDLSNKRTSSEILTPTMQNGASMPDIVATQLTREPVRKKPRKTTAGPGGKSVRRLWTPEEEHALREGLKTKGAHWAGILSMYGMDGTISEALKDRNQVQLKDKARNWKMYYLKEDIPLPDYLKGVTGELALDKQKGNGRFLGKRRLERRKGATPSQI